MSSYLPLMLDVSNRRILLLGGGRASAEKLRTLETLGVSVTAISRKFSDEFYGRQWLKLEEREYRRGDLQGFDIVYAGIGGSPALESVIEEASEIPGLLLNVIDSAENSDFISVSGILRENFAVFVSTMGRAPGFARSIREKIESALNLSRLDDEARAYIQEREDRKKNQSY